MLLTSVNSGRCDADGAGPFLSVVASVNLRTIVRLPTAGASGSRWRSGRMIFMLFADSELRRG
jgi:hypothetical protein